MKENKLYLVTILFDLDLYNRGIKNVSISAPNKKELTKYINNNYKNPTIFKIKEL